MTPHEPASQDDNRVPYRIDSWTAGINGELHSNHVQFAPLTFVDRAPLVDPSDAVHEIRVSFPKQRRERRRAQGQPGHRRRSFSPRDSASLDQHLRRGYTLSEPAFRNLTGSADSDNLKIRNAFRPDAESAITRQELARFQLQVLERQRRRRWLLKDAADSLLYSLNLYSESDLHNSPYPNS